MKKLQLLTMSVVLAVGSQVNAEDYTYLFDPATMVEGETLGEYLVVKASCPDDKGNCASSEKMRYVTATAGRTGRLEIPVDVSDNFEISFNIVVPCNGNLIYTLYFADGSSWPIEISGHSCTGGSAQVFAGGTSAKLNWTGAIDDFRLIAEGEKLKIGANDVFVLEANLSGTIGRIVISKIDDRERLFEIRTRGIQKGGSTSCPTTTPTTSTGDCTANYDPASGRVIIPCIAVPVTLPFGGAQTLNYSVELQQQLNTFTFDLDLSKITQK